MEVVELLRLDNAAHELETLEVLARAHTHSVKVDLGHGVNDALARRLAVLLTSDGIGGDDLVDELANSLLECTVVLSSGPRH